MAYKDLTILDLERQFGIKNIRAGIFSPELPALTPSDRLNEQLDEAALLPMRTEKARSELVVTPILLELRRRNQNYFTIYSGDVLNVDKELGLNGECDFLLARDTGSYSLNTPIFTVVEAKKQDMDLGIDQCAAQMAGIKFFNEKMGTDLPIIYGCVTTVDNWQFLKLENKQLTVDSKVYYLVELEKILGIFQYIIDYFKQTLPETSPISA